MRSITITMLGKLRNQVQLRPNKFSIANSNWLSKFWYV